jgi:subtilisin family serine protease
MLAVLAGAAAAQATTFPNDPYYAPYEWYGPTLGLPAAWSLSTGSSGVTIAILDTGVIANTPDLAGRVLPAVAPSDVTVMDGTTIHHGTWVASVAAMGVNNHIGGAGVGNFSILPVTVTDDRGTNSSWDIAQGITLAAGLGAKVINISQATLEYGSLDQAAGAARAAGVLVFVAAGNSNSRNPMAAYDNLIFVSGTDANDQRWQDPATGAGSTWGPFVDLSAPATGIVVAEPDYPSGYGLAQGTSFAAPLAAGAAALAWSINPNLTADQVEAMLYSSAVDLGDPGWDEVYGYGRLNIEGVAEDAYLSTLPEPQTLVLLAVGAIVAVVVRRHRAKSRTGHSR